EMGTKPVISLDGLTAVKPVIYKVNVTDEMVNEEVEKLVTKHGEMKEDVEEIGAPENVLNVIFRESDAAGKPLPDSTAKDNSILVKYFAEDFRPQLYGKKKDDFIVLQLKNAFPEKEREWIISDLGLDKNDEASLEKYFRMSIQKIGLVEKKELNEDFFNVVFSGKEIKTEEDFRNTLREELQTQWDAASRGQMHDQLYHLLIDIPLKFPDEFLKRWIAVGGEKKKTTEEVEAEYPSFTNQLKWTLISDKVINENKIDVTEEELRDAMKQEIMRYFGQMNMGEDMTGIDGYVDRMMKDEKQVDSSYRRILTEKLFNWLEKQVTPEEKETSPDELLAMQHHHSH
ncbi:MAG: trigger factor, partial [Bacteroidota bacterium]|nr:trigger factor [Bacteroidota bacterium]